MSEREEILRMEGVTVEAQGEYDSAVWDVDLVLRSGELALLRLERGNVHLPLADAAAGLVEAAEGRVWFCGRDWQEMSAIEAARSRGQIGRVFDRPAWIGSMDVGENILLAQAHHSRRALGELLSEAGELAGLFGLPGLPRTPPGRTHPQDLQRSGCVRGFMGRPRLILLERPEAECSPEIVPPLMAAIGRARSAGAAVLWQTAEAEVWRDRGIRPSQRLMMSGSQVLTAG